MTAGRRNHPITIERKTITLSDTGSETESWPSVVGQMAEVIFGSGNERREAAQKQASQTATFIVLDTPVTRAVVPMDRIQFDGAAWDITSAAQSRRYHRMRELTALRAAR